ncbi:MAG: nicotinate phosphoribosyltransferase, partial [Syntrophobacteraceae bacterium]
MNSCREFAIELMMDLYELTMAESYLKEKMTGEASFDLFIRNYPAHRGYFIAAGLEHLIELISKFHFTADSLDYLTSTSKFSAPFLDYLKDFRFTGSIRAMPEGSIFFSQEPILEVTAPIIEAQILETLIINTIQLEILYATKAARCIQAARGRDLVDFSMRRTHGVEASLKVARASYIAGFSGTSNVLAGKLYGIPVIGTMAHSYITSFEHEMDSFLAFSRAYPDNTVILIDTYDTLRGAEKALEVARQMAAEGKKLKGVRLDSGDLVDLSKRVRKMFIEAGFADLQILASGNLDEYSIEDLLHSGAQIDLFAVGTKLGTSSDAPYLDIAYKIVEYAGRPLLKLSSAKKTRAGKKQVYRLYDSNGKMKEDLLCLISEEHPEGTPLLRTVVRNGTVEWTPEPLHTIRDRLAEELSNLPEAYKTIRGAPIYTVRVSAILEELQEKTEEERRREEIDLDCAG